MHNSAIACRQRGLGFFGNLSHSGTPGCASGMLRQRLAIKQVIPTDFCYNSHRSIPLDEGLNGGRVALCLAAVGHAPVLFLPTCCALSCGCASYPLASSLRGTEHP